MISGRVSIGRSVLLTFFFLGALVSVFPFLWMIMGVTQNPNDVVSGSLVPGDQLAENWVKINRNYDVLRFLYNSLKIAVSTVAAGLLVNSLAAFGFEKYPSVARERIFGALLISMLLPQMAIVIPLFKQMVSLKLLNTHASVILPSVVTVFILFFLRQNFKMFPTEIMEAARVDGAAELRIFFSITVPSMKATFVSAGIYIFILQWNSYLWPLMTILSDEMKTLPIAIASVMRAYVVEYGGLMIIVCISVLPVIILFLTMQKQFVQGLMGSIK